MSTLEGAVPLGLGITRLRLWDELQLVHCKTMDASPSTWSHQEARGATHFPSRLENPPTRSQTRDSSRPIEHVFKATGPQTLKMRVQVPASPAGREKEFSDHLACLTHSASSIYVEDGLSKDDESKATPSRAQATKDDQGFLLPPLPPKPRPSGQKPPPLVARIKAKARRAKRKQQKAEHRRRLFLTHLVQVTRLARRSRSLASHEQATSSIEPTSSGQHATWLFPECLGTDLASFVETVFDTDAQSSEITAASEISDADLAEVTRTEIEVRRRLGGADVELPERVFRWMVASDFAERWPNKAKHVRENPWPGLEGVWGSPSGSVGAKGGEAGMKEEEPVRWQSGRRSSFVRRKKGGGTARQMGSREHAVGVSRPAAHSDRTLAWPWSA